MTDQLQQTQPRLHLRGPQAQQVATTPADNTGVQLAAASSLSLRPPSRLLPDAPDERLVDALRRGDERAFEAIYDRYHRALLGFCRHMLGSREEAEDALQQVFVAAHRHLLDGTGSMQLRPWLYAIARNRCLSMLHARRDTCPLEAAPEPSTDGLAVAEEVERREDIEEMLSDLARLPDEQRAALLLAELGDLSQREIAAALDVRPEKVKALIFQAREALAGWRQARATDCREIQAQLATARGSALRRQPIRRHVALCTPCAAFEREVARQRRAMALLLPAVPTAALKHNVLSTALSAGSGAASAGVAGVAASSTVASATGVGVGAGAGFAGAGASGLAVKALAVAALAIGAGGGGAVAVRELTPPARHAGVTAPKPTPAGRAAPAAVPVPVVAGSDSGAASDPHRAPVTRPSRDQARGHSADAPGRADAQDANGRGPQQAAKRRRAATSRPLQTTRPAPTRSRRPATARSPVAKSPAAKAPARKNRATTPATSRSPSRGLTPRRHAEPATPATPATPTGNAGNAKAS